MGSSGPKSASTLSKDQQLLAKSLVDYVMPQIGQPAAAYPGQLVPNLLGGYQQISNNLSGMQGFTQQTLSGLQQPINSLLTAQAPEGATDTVRALMAGGARTPGLDQALGQLLSGRSSNALSEAKTNQYFKAAVETPAMELLNQQVLPEIDRAFAGVGAFSSRKAVEKARAIGNFNTSLLSERAKAQMENQRINAGFREAALNRMVQGAQLGLQAQGQQSQFMGQGVGLASALQQAQFGNMAQGVQLGLGAQGQAFGQTLTLQDAMMRALAPQQERLDLQSQAAYNEFQRTLPINSPANQLALAILGGQHTQLYNKPSPFGSALTGGIGGAMAGGALGFTGVGLPIMAGLGALGGFLG